METIFKRQNLQIVKQATLIVMLSAALTACGGGGGSSTTTSAGVEPTVLSLAARVDAGTLSEEAFIASLPAAVL